MTVNELPPLRKSVDLQKIREYAHHYNLTAEHDAVSPMSRIELPRDAMGEDSLSLQNVHRIPPLPNSKSPFSERLQVSKESTKFLESVIALGQQQHPSKKREGWADEYERAKRLKIEEPLLCFENWCWNQRAGERLLDVPLRSLGLCKDPAEDYGFGLSVEESKAAEELRRNYTKEKLEVNSEAMMFLRESVRVVKRDLLREYLEGELQPSNIPQKISPPLSPLKSHYTSLYPPVSYDLEPDTTRCELDDENIRKRVVEEHLVITEDVVELLESTRKLMFGPSLITDDVIPPLDISNGFAEAYKPISDLKIDVPLMPLTPSQSDRKVKKTVHFSDEVFEIPRFFATPDDGRPSSSRDDSVEREIEKVFRPAATKIMQEIEQAQLIEADNTDRVTVPIMDFSLPTPPWEDKNADGILRGLRKQMGKEGEKWNYRKSIDIDELVWKLTGSVKDMGIGDMISAEEQVKFDEIMGEYLDLGPRIELKLVERDFKFLKEGELAAEEELEYAPMKPKNDLDSLIRRKKERTGVDTLLSGLFSEKVKILNIRDAPKRQLSTFLSLRNQKQTISIEEEMSPLHSALSSERGTTTPQVEIPIKGQIYTPAVTNLPERIFIVSTTLLENRKLYKQLTSLYKAATFVERDLIFTKPTISLNSSPDPHFPHPKSSEASCNNEVDIIASPKTGIIITTIQKVRQKPLPGQKLTDDIRDRIAAASERYEQTIVLVSFTADGGLSPYDSQAFASFAACMDSLDTGVDILLVEDAGKGIEVARWVISVLAEYGAEFDKDMRSRIADDRQSLWESFLRQAGFNLLAARVVTSMLLCRGCNGLLGFVAMSGLERKKIYGKIVGERILDKFDSVVGTRFPCS